MVRRQIAGVAVFVCAAGTSCTRPAGSGASDETTAAGDDEAGDGAGDVEPAGCGECGEGEVCLEEFGQCVDGCSVYSLVEDPPDYGVDVMFVVSRAATMGNARFELAKSAIDTLVSLAPEGSEFGLELFPGAEAQDEFSSIACAMDPGVDATLAPESEMNVNLTMDAVDSFKGSGPITQALLSSYDVLEAMQDERRKVTVVITDGEHYCEPQQSCSGPADCPLLTQYVDPLEEITFAADGRGIVTGFVGADPLDPERLAALVQAYDGFEHPGEPERPFDPTSPEELALVYEQLDPPPFAACGISNKVLDPEPDASDSPAAVYSAGGVELERLPEGSECGLEPGYTFESFPDVGLSVVLLCGPSCEAYRADPRLTIVYGCQG